MPQAHHTRYNPGSWILSRRSRRGKNHIGTTGRGIGPYEDKEVARRGITLGEFVDPAVTTTRLDEVLPKSRLLRNDTVSTP